MPSDGLVDLHCHLLPGIDDGAKTLEETLEMAQLLSSLGFTKVAPSPHNRPEFSSRAVAEVRLGEVREFLRRENVELELFPNSENFLLDPKFMETLGTEHSRPIGNGPYILAEAPYTTPFPAMPEMVFRTKLKGITLVVAHPERCLEFQQQDHGARAVQVGAVLQLDVGALTGRYGRIAKKVAHQYLEAGLYGIAATDLHSPRDAKEWVTASLTELRNIVGDKGFDVLLRENPAKILRGEKLD